MKTIHYTFLFLHCKLFIFCLLADRNQGSTKTIKEPCVTKGCILSAGEIIENVDYSVLPCVHFYNFVCKNYAGKTPLEGTVQKELHSVRRDQYFAELNVILSKPKELEERLSFRKAKDIFFTCMNSTASDQINALLDFLDSLGGWPLLGGKFDEKQFQWSRLTNDILRFGLFKAAAINPLVKNENSKSKFYLGVNLESNKDLIRLLSKRKNFIENYINYIGLNESVSRHIRAIKNFAKEVQEILGHKNDEENTMTVSSLDINVPQVYWDAFLEQLYDTTVHSEDYITIYSLGKFKELIALFAITNKTLLANWYISLVIVSMYSENLFTPEFTKIIMEDDQGTSIARHCILFISRLFPSSIKVMHQKKYFQPMDTIELKKMEHFIELEIKHFLQTSPFFTSEYTNNILNVLQIESAIDEAEDSELEDFSEETKKCFPVSRKNYLRNALLLSSEKFWKHLNITKNTDNQKLKRKKDDLTFLNGYPVFEMDLEAESSKLSLPPSLLRGFFFSSERPNSLNYGTLGFSITQEIFNRLDSKEFLPEVTEFKHCIENQFNFELFDYHFEQSQLAPVDHTVDTLARDILGIRVAYAAFKQASNWTGPEASLPGLNFTPKQLFWISYALSMCQAFDFDELMKLQPQVLGRTRVLHLIPNIPEFSEDFDCPLDYKMNPRERCILK